MKDLILIGKQGSGKGTQGKILAEKFGFKIFETGGALRALASGTSELGKKVKEIMNRGDLVSNDLVMEIVQDFLSKIEGDVPVIFDGIPRSEVQKESLEKVLQESGREFQVLEITLSDEEALTRLTVRAQCNKCGANFGGEVCPECGSDDLKRRSDDVPDAITKRLENFQLHTAPLVEMWRKDGKVLAINGNQDIEKVTTDIFEKLS